MQKLPMTTKRITPKDYLPKGQKVIVKNRRGTVTEAKEAKDQFGLPICSHTIRFTETKAVGSRRWTSIEPKEESVNYSFIHAITN